MKLPALVRPIKEGPIVRTYLDTITEDVLGFNFPIVGYEVREESETHLDSLGNNILKYMYEMLSKDSNCIAVTVINFRVVLGLKYDHVLVYRILHNNHITYAVKNDNVNLFEKSTELIPVGFLKTKVYTEEALITPERIYYSTKMNKIYLRGYWKRVNDIKLIEAKNKAFYKKLLDKDNYEGIINTQEGELYIDYGGNIDGSNK